MEILQDFLRIWRITDEWQVAAKNAQYWDPGTNNNIFLENFYYFFFFEFSLDNTTKTISKIPIINFPSTMFPSNKH
jgi:hypothetical protein